jgi:hypothetical protein
MADISKLTADPKQLEREATARLLSTSQSARPPGASPSTHPTLAHGSGQLMRRAGRLPWLLAGGAVLTLVVVVVTLKVGSDRAQPAIKQPAPGVAATSSPRLIRIQIETTPSGAALLRAGDLSPVGTTPWVREQAPQAGDLELIARRPGYRDLPIRIALDRNVQIQRDLMKKSDSDAGASRRAPKDGRKKAAKPTPTPTPTTKTKPHGTINQQDIID